MRERRGAGYAPAPSQVVLAINPQVAQANPLRFNNFAYAARETVRHALHRLAPDADVVRCSWYSNQTRRDRGISRRQRAIYAVQGGLSDEFVKESLGLDADGFHAALIKAVDDLNKYTHIEPSTFAISEVEVERLTRQTLAGLRALLDTVAECRNRIVERLEAKIDVAAADQVLSDC